MPKANCTFPSTGEKRWSYQQYYIGYKDKEGRRNKDGENNWSGAKSLEQFRGNFTNDTIHGAGDYRWKGLNYASITHEGYFFCNNIHGYGTMSYSDGRTFYGLFMNNVRWGPGIEAHANLHNDVGLWRGRQLLRLSWRPLTPTIVPDFVTNSSGRAYVEKHRVLLRHTVEKVGEVNDAIKLLKECGANPQVAAQKWDKLYPKYCTDIASALCDKHLFYCNYYGESIHMLKQIYEIPCDEDVEDVPTYFAWNNNNIMINMMKHSFKHDVQRNNLNLDIKLILSGPRSYFKPPGSHELGCRNLLMASYLGHIEDVAKLVTENHIHPDVSDVQGNSAIMYATCGDQQEIINFLVEAGANVDGYNDSCCTALGVALIRYICMEHDIPHSRMLQALLPPLSFSQPPVEQKVLEWNIIRDEAALPLEGVKAPSKTRILSSKKIKSLLSVDQTASRRKTESLPTSKKLADDFDEKISEENRVYNNLEQEYNTKVTSACNLPVNTNPTPYLFDINDLIKEIEANEDEKKLPEKNVKKVASKTIKDTIKISGEIMQKCSFEKQESLSSIQEQKRNALSKVILTIVQLLANDADPRRVKCPQPAMLIAALCNSPELTRHLIQYGADVNENYHQIHNYAPLDIALSRPFTYDTLNKIKVLLENGANTSHRLLYKPDPITNGTKLGPTVLHVALGRKTENDLEEHIRLQIIELLLKHNCNPTVQFKGRSAIDIAMNKNIEIFNIFIKNPRTDLNAAINDTNQTILTKIFHLPFCKSIASAERLQMLTNLLLYGCDPLLKCQNGDEIYDNIFVFAKRTLMEMESSQNKNINLTTGKENRNAKKKEKPQKEEKLFTKSVGKMSVDEIEDYRQAIELVQDSARLIYMRWLKTKLFMKAVEIINKYKHRHWNIILREFIGNMNIGLWLTPQNCIEIYNLHVKKNKKYNDAKILKHLLCIVIFMSWQYYGKLHSDVISIQNINANVKNAIELDMNSLLRQHKVTKYDLDTETNSITNRCLKNVLPKDIHKFDVCFDCMLPLYDDKILCCCCELVAFCSLPCMKMNIKRMNCHPCSDYIKTKYFPTSKDSITMALK